MIWVWFAAWCAISIIGGLLTSHWTHHTETHTRKDKP